MARSIPDLDGVLCPLITPFAERTVEPDALVSLIDHVQAGDIDGLVPCGTTGESASLTLTEHETVVETTVEHAGDLPVIVGAAATSVSDVVDRIDIASSAGADAVLVPPPYFHNANHPAGQRAFFEAVADAATLPVYLYNIPSCTGREIELDVLEEVSTHEWIAGLKDTSGDGNYFTETLRRTPTDFQVFQGFDSQLFPGLLSGATGGINALSNVFPESFALMYRACSEDDVATAREIHRTQVSPLFQACLDHGFAPVCKAGLVEQGIIESSEVRPPLVSLSEDAREHVRSLVAVTN